jgi:phosphoribosyl 1,2-cyclic phosphodiesterase
MNAMNAKTALPRLAAAVGASSIGAYLLSAQTQCERASPTPIPSDDHVPSSTTSNQNSRLIFMGSGSSTGCPRPLCPMIFKSGTEKTTVTPELKRMRQQMEPWCKVSSMAIDGDPKQNKNYRNNPSLLISQCDDSTGNCKNVIIDVGKTFREGALRWFPERGITSLDAIVLTHGHMDAVAGLDDVRGFQKYEGTAPVKHGRPKSVPVPVHLSQSCLDDVADRFPWLFPNQQPPKEKEPSDKPTVERHVASFDVQVFQSFKPFEVEGLTIVPLPVMHGEDLVSFGFTFCVGGKTVVYLSDISRMLPETLEYIHTKLPEVDILVLDSLLPVGDNPVHFSLEQAMELAKQIRPKQTYLLGMSCDSFPPHDEMNETLKRDYGNVQFAHDGLELDLSGEEEVKSSKAMKSEHLETKAKR